MISKINEAIIFLSSWVELSILTKATIMLILGLTLVGLFKNARASVRHLFLVATFVALLSLPLIVVITPEITVDIPINYPDSPITELSNVSTSKSLKTNSSSYLEQRTLDSSNWSLISIMTIVRLGWAIGFFILFVSLVLNLWRLRRLKQNGLPWLELRDYIKSLASECGIRRTVKILLHEDIKIPVTYGVLHPVILLPSDAYQWSEASLRRVLIHELEHIKRGDWFCQLMARTTYAIYWFHPLVWIAWRRLCLESERACDDAVVQHAESIEYADQLLVLAQRLSKPLSLPTVGMANRSDLSIRLSAILDNRQRRGQVGLLTSLSIVLIGSILVLAIAPIKAVMQSSVIQISSSVNTKFKSKSPKDNSIDNVQREISKIKRDRGQIFYKRKENNSIDIKSFRTGNYKHQMGYTKEINIKKLQTRETIEKLQAENQRTEIETRQAEKTAITKRQEANLEKRNQWAKKEAVRAANITKRQKLDAERRKRWAEMETMRAKNIAKQQEIDLEKRKRWAKIQAKKDEAIARKAGIIPK